MTPCCCRDFSQIYILKRKQDRVSSTAVVSSTPISYIHDDFLSGGIVGDVADGLLLICHWLCGVHNVLEHGSLSARGETDQTRSEIHINTQKSIVSAYIFLKHTNSLSAVFVRTHLK